MTKHEAVVISAYTGYLFVKCKDLLPYLSRKLGRHLFAEGLCKEIFDSVHDAVLEDVMQIDFDGNGEPVPQGGDVHE